MVFFKIRNSLCPWALDIQVGPLFIDLDNLFENPRSMLAKYWVARIFLSQAFVTRSIDVVSIRSMLWTAEPCVPHFWSQYSRIGRCWPKDHIFVSGGIAGKYSPLKLIFIIIKKEEKRNYLCYIFIILHKMVISFE